MQLDAAMFSVVCEILRESWALYLKSCEQYFSHASFVGLWLVSLSLL